jgi:hypothetical protein
LRKSLDAGAEQFDGIGVQGLVDKQVGGNTVKLSPLQPEDLNN